MKITIDIQEMEGEIDPFEASISKCVVHGTLTDGRPYQVHVVLTTDEDDFIDEEQIDIN